MQLSPETNEPADRIEFKPIGMWELKLYLTSIEAECRHDVDSDVRLIKVEDFQASRVEGFYLNGRLAGFGRIGPYGGVQRHLSHLFVGPNARGRGLGMRYLMARTIEQLHVIPHNARAIALYERAGFVFKEKILRRNVMVRPA